MESVEEENDENVDPGNNFDPEDSEDDLGETDSIAKDKKLNAITAGDKLGMACFRCVTKNSFSIPNCQRQANGVSDRSKASNAGWPSSHFKSVRQAGR